MPIAGRRTGILTLRKGPVWYDVSYVEGRANRVESSSADDSLPMLLAKRGALSEDVAKEVIARVQMGKGDPVQALLERGALSADKMEGLLRWRATSLVERMVTWTEGTYSFRQLFEAKMTGTPLALKLPQLLLGKLLEAGDVSDISSRLTPWMRSSPQLAQDPTLGLEEYGLNKADASLIRALNGKNLLSEVLADPPIPLERAVMVVWFMLVSGGLDAEEMVTDAPEQPVARAMPPDISQTGPVDEPVDQPELVEEPEEPSNPEDRVSALGRSLFGDSFALDESAKSSLASAPEEPRFSMAEEVEEEAQPDTTRGEDFGSMDEGALNVEQRDRLTDLKLLFHKMETMNYVDILGLDPECTAEDVRQAYFALAKQYHPDHFSSQPGPLRKAVQAIFARIGEAHGHLESDSRRRAYIDKVIHGKKDAQEIAMEQARRLMDAEGAYKMGRRLLIAGQLTDAHNKFRAAKEGDPEEAEYRCFFGYTTFLLHNGHDQERAQTGVDVMTEAANTSKNPEHYHVLAKVAIKQGNDEFALELLKRVLRRQRANEEALREFRECEQRVDKARRKQEGRLSGLFARFKRD